MAGPCGTRPAGRGGGLETVVADTAAGHPHPVLRAVFGIRRRAYFRPPLVAVFALQRALRIAIITGDGGVWRTGIFIHGRGREILAIVWSKILKMDDAVDVICDARTGDG